MADKKISQLTGATTPVAGTEVLPIVQGGNTVKVSIANLTAGRSISSAGASLDGAVTINDSGADVDMRVEGDTDANLLFADASTDRIGIGTNSPAYKLDVTAAGASTAANVFSMTRITGADAVANDLTLVGPNTSQVRVKFGDPDDATVGEIGYDNATNSMRVVTNGNQVARFDSSGNFGLTSSTLSAWSGRTAIQIPDSGYVVASGANLLVGSNVYFNGTNRTYISTAAAADYRQINGEHRWESAASGTADTTISFSTTMTLTAAGNLGIGTATPGQKLEVAGNLRFSGSQVGTKIQPRQTGIEVTTSATTIIDDAGGFGSVVVVNGEAGGDRFCDLLFASTAASPTVISSFAAFGSPAARTYTRSGGALQLAMASGTYTVWALALGY
jgi:hypothetical protein